MRILIDTNVFLVIVSNRSEYHWLFLAFLAEVFELVITNEIVLEYEEQFIAHWDEIAATDAISLIVDAPNSVFYYVHYYFNLVKDDPDDNKFADGAVVSGADYLVTFDKHFNSLKQLDFPKVNVVHPNEFKQILLDKNLIEP
jgi:putative PIN family toxin of toxin-antitoxin system